LLRTRVSDKSMETLGKLTNLAVLNLDYTDVGDEGLAKLSGLEKLESLSLDSANISDASVGLLGGFHSLKNLNLYHTLVSEDGFSKLRTALQGCELVWDALSSQPTRRRT
jgi:hypothetical protein